MAYPRGEDPTELAVVDDLSPAALDAAFDEALAREERHEHEPGIVRDTVRCAACAGPSAGAGGSGRASRARRRL
jgi:hypothetical protein